MDQLRSNQFSSQERNQDSLNEILHEVHDDFHTYFVLIVTVLCGMISAIVFLLILATIAKCCCSGGHANCKTQPSKYKVSDIMRAVNRKNNSFCLRTQQASLLDAKEPLSASVLTITEMLGLFKKLLSRSAENRFYNQLILYIKIMFIL